MRTAQMWFEVCAKAASQRNVKRPVEFTRKCKFNRKKGFSESARKLSRQFLHRRPFQRRFINRTERRAHGNTSWLGNHSKKDE